MTSRLVMVVQLKAVVQLRYGTDAGDDSDDDAGSVQMRAEAGAAVATRNGCDSLARTIRRDLRGPDGANRGYAGDGRRNGMGHNSHFYVDDILDKWTDGATSVGREGEGSPQPDVKGSQTNLDAECRHWQGERCHRSRQSMYECSPPSEDKTASIGESPGNKKDVGGGYLGNWVCSGEYKHKTSYNILIVNKTTNEG